MTPIGTPAFRALLGACDSWLSQGAWQPPAEAVDWHRVGRLGFFHNLEPLLHRLAEERRLPVAEIPADVLATWESAHYRNYLFNTRALEILDRLARAADESSLPFAVFKGPVTLARVYGDPALRMMVDLDLILRRRDLEPLTRLAAGLGFCDGGHLHPLHTITTHPKLGLALELHFDLYDFLLRRDELVDRVLEARVELEIDGRSFPAAPPELALVLEIGHLVQHDFRIGLRNWLDLAALLGAAHAPLDWQLLRTALATHGLLDEFLLAVEVTTRLFGRPPAAVPFVRASGYAEQARAGVIEQVAHIDRGVERAALQELAQRRGLGAKLSYLGHRLLPTGSRWRALKAGRGTRSALATLGRETIQSAARELARWRTAGLAVRGGSIKAAVHTRNRRRRAE